ncbi:MAG: branched-chain amino acid aminotransferase [Sphingobacteriales bacterium]|jgi:branched-chain amino acid aminotransferase
MMEELMKYETEVNITEKIDFANLKFGEKFSANMLIIDYKDGKWGDAEIVPFGKISFSPSLSALHYGQVVFEGMKAFHQIKDDGVIVFRPEKHWERLNRSSARLCIPPIDKDVFINGLKELVALDKSFVPNKKGNSLYIRPFSFATDSFLGVKVSDTYRFMIICSPVGAYFKEGLNPVSLLTVEKFSRGVEGGLGAAKTPANYAASMMPASQAKKRGFAEVVWLDGKEKKYIDEVGTMNIFFRFKDELVTPPLSDTILAGVTRDSVITIAKEWGIPVNERKVTIEEVCKGIESGLVTEVFGTGTAAVISAVGKIEHHDVSYELNDGKVGEWSKRLFNEITGIQYGEIVDTHNWCERIV